jgi:Sigma-70 region 2
MTLNRLFMLNGVIAGCTTAGAADTGAAGRPTAASLRSGEGAGGAGPLRRAVRPPLPGDPALPAAAGRHQLADDLAAETFTLAFRRRHQYRGEHADAAAWLYGIAGGRCCSGSGWTADSGTVAAVQHRTPAETARPGGLTAACSAAQLPLASGQTSQWEQWLGTNRVEQAAGVRPRIR